MRLPSLGLPALLMLSLLAGCTAPAPAPGTTAPSVTPPLDPWPAVQAAMVGVPCEAAVGDMRTNSENLKMLGNISLPSSNDGIHAELDIRGDLGIHARYAAGGFEVYDLRDPMHPLHLGNFTEADGGLDVKFGPDNVTVFVGTGGGVTIADMSDPMHPVKTGEYTWADLPAPPEGPAHDAVLNAHMLYTKRIAGQDWLFLAPNAQTGIWVFLIEGAVGNHTLRYVSQTLPVQGGPLGPHDLYVQEDPTDGAWYLYSADGFHGWSAFDVSDPANPVLAGGFVNPAEGAYTHTVQAVTLGGKRIVATIGEIGGNFLRVYDASVLRAPVLLAVWAADNPAAAEHNFNIAGDSLYLAYYGHGMYVFNLTQALTQGLGVPLVGAATLKPTAHWAARGEGGFNGYWDALVKDGILYVSDIEGGLIVLGYGCNKAPDPLLNSDG